ncbi:MAG: lysylphosphatidylglycerol synthase transmembrane domain-containing protein [Candidatus Paceibacterota bacterium]|jgi:uncharacterized protein (TIRG00374 family)
MKKLLLFVLSLIVGLGMVFWVLQMVSPEEFKKDLEVFKGSDGLIILVLSFLTIFMGAWRWKEILKGIGEDLPFRKMVSPFLAGFSVMFLAPVLVWGGEALRAYILKKRDNIPWSKGMASVIIDRILEWTANLAVIFLGGIVFIFLNGFPLNNLIWVILGAFLVLAAFLIYFFVKCYKRESIVSIFFKKRNLWNVEKEIFKFFKEDKLAVWKAVFLSFLRAAVMYARVWFLIAFLGKSIGALSALAILGFSYLAVMVPIPTALGTHEAIQSFAFNSMGLGISSAAAFTMIIRAADLMVSFIGIIFLFRFGIIMIKDKILNKIDNLTDED